MGGLGGGEGEEREGDKGEREREEKSSVWNYYTHPLSYIYNVYIF